jgi:mannose-6-phosphate isomerase-like protein (cupin superfamily)
VFPTAAEYASARACHGALTVVDLQAEQAAVTAGYDNRVLLDVDDHCMRLAVFEGEYRWHHHPESDELFLVAAGTLEIDVDGGERITLAPWQAVVIPAGTVHRTRAIGRTVNATFERQGARTVFVERPVAA